MPRRTAVDVDAQTADLAEHKIGTELDRLAATELARMRRAIAAKERREQSRYIGAALADVAGSRYTPGELAAACTGAIRAALASTRGMRLTADDWSDLRSDLMVAALRRAYDCDLTRVGSPRIMVERTGTGRPADVLAYVDRWLRQPARLRIAVGDADNAKMPRREDLAGKEQRDPGAYLHGAARNLVAKIAERGATDTEKRASTAETDAAAAKDAPSDPLNMTELGAALKASKREQWALENAAGAAPAELAAEHGKSLGAMRTALDKGRNSLRARTDANSLRALGAALRTAPDPSMAPDWTLTMLRVRPLYPTPRNAPIGAARAADVLRYIAAVEASMVDVPASALETADAHLRRTADTRRNSDAPRSTGGWLTTDHPVALVPAPCTCQTAHPDAPCDGCDDRWRIVPAIGPVNVRTMAADLPTLNRRALNGHRLWTALALRNRPCQPVAYSAPRPYRAVHLDLTDARTMPARTPHAPLGHPASDYVPAYNPHWQDAPSGGATPVIPTRTATGPLTMAVRADLTERRHYAIQAARRARLDERERAITDGKLTILPAE
jgi:hypothetical protein